MTTTQSVSIRQADAVQAIAGLAPGSIDALISDPPYCSGGYQEAARLSSRGMMRTKRSQDAWFDGDAMGTAGLCVLLRGVAIEAAQALRRGGSMLLFCDWRMVSAVAPAVESAGFRQRGLIVWDKGSLGQGSLGFRPQHELILWYIKGDMSERPPGLRTRGNVLHHKRVPPAARIHPTEKPVALLRDLIECTVPEGGLIADPFAGSGALGVAALEMGRRALLSDADPRWVEAMEARFAVSPGQATGTG